MNCPLIEDTDGLSDEQWLVIYRLGIGSRYHRVPVSSLSEDRRSAILRAVVEQYIKTSQPVSSSHVSDVAPVRASSATIRAEMAGLERDGYLQQPHTSAGRIPTDLGYRFFVDHLDSSGSLPLSQQQTVRQFFDHATGEIEQILHEAGGLLSRITGSTALVVTPHYDTATVRSAQLVSLDTTTALAVVVLSNGVVEKRTIELPTGTSEIIVTTASARLNNTLCGVAFNNIQLIASGDQQVDQLVEAVVNALRPNHSEIESVYVGGTSKVAEAFEAVDTVREVLSILEQQYVVVSLIKDLLDRGVTVSIGTENNVESLAQCALVVAPTIIDGEQRGSVAVLGPTRMNYAQAMAAVSVVGKQIGERLGQVSSPIEGREG